MAVSSTESPTTQDETGTEGERKVQAVRERLYRVADSLDVRTPELVEASEWFVTGAEQELAAKGHATFLDVLLDPDLSCLVFGKVTSGQGTDLRAWSKGNCSRVLEDYGKRAPTAAKVLRRELDITALEFVADSSRP